MVPSVGLALASKVADLWDGVHDVKILERKDRKMKISGRLTKEASAKPTTSKWNLEFSKWGDLVLKVAGHVQKGTSASKFTPKWLTKFFYHSHKWLTKFSFNKSMITTLNASYDTNPIVVHWLRRKVSKRHFYMNLRKHLLYPARLLMQLYKSGRQLHSFCIKIKWSLWADISLMILSNHLILSHIFSVAANMRTNFETT